MIEDSQNIGELIVRCLFCIFVYLVIAYKIERLRKQAFFGREAGQKTFHRWLKIFDTFPEGLAVVKGGDVIYSNHSLMKLFELKDYKNDDDPYFDKLRDNLSHVQIKKLDKDDGKETTVWKFIDSNETGAAYQLSYELADNGDDDDNQKTPNTKQSQLTKFISLNKVKVDLGGDKEKLVVVRDLSPLVNL